MGNFISKLIFLVSILISNQTISQGLFLSEQNDKTIAIPLSYITIANNIDGPDGSIVFDRFSNGTPILPTLYGNNASSWMGKKILNDDVRKTHLRNVGITYMRFPGGNLSNNYFWDGNIPNLTKQDANFSPISGTDNAWRLTVDDFLRLCDTLNNTPIICVNASYARYGNSNSNLQEAAHYAANFVRYVNGIKGAGVKYWEIGNENYGSWQAGYIVEGDTIDGAKYGEIVKVFSDSMKAADPTIKVGAVVVTKDGDTYEGHNWWNKKMMPICIEKADFWITHQYFVFDNLDWNNITTNQILNSTHLIKETIDNVQETVAKYTSYSADYLPVAMTEYNLRGGAKEVAQVSALFLADCIGEFIKNKYGMVLLWDIQNGTKEPNSDAPGGDHGFYSWNDPVLPNGTPRPAFFTYYYLKKVLGNMSSETLVLGDSIISYSSVDSKGNNGIVVINQSDIKKKVTIKPSDNSSGNLYWFVIHAASKTDKKININGEESNLYSEGGPENYATIPPFMIPTVSTANIELEANSVSFFIFETSSPTNNDAPNIGYNKITYPNPTADIVYWDKNCNYELFNANGKLILKGSGNQINLVHLSQGNYVLKKNGESEIISKID